MDRIAKLEAENASLHKLVEELQDRLSYDLVERIELLEAENEKLHNVVTTALGWLKENESFKAQDVLQEALDQTKEDTCPITTTP